MERDRGGVAPHETLRDKGKRIFDAFRRHFKDENLSGAGLKPRSIEPDQLPPDLTIFDQDAIHLKDDEERDIVVIPDPDPDSSALLGFEVNNVPDAKSHIDRVIDKLRNPGS